MKYEILERILNKFESSKTDWQEEATGNRSFRIQQELINALGKGSIIEEAKQLEQDGLWTVKWFNNRSDIELINYELKNIRKFYALTERTPKLDKVKKQLAYMKQQLNICRKSWIRAYYAECMNRIDQGKIINNWDQELLLGKCMCGLDQLQEPIFKRIFSRRYLHNSKTFEQKLQSRVISIAKRHHDDIDDNMDDTTILSQLLIEEYKQELEAKGNLLLNLEGKQIDLSEWRYGTVLNSETLKYAHICEKQKIQKIITVENKANYVMMPIEEGTLIIFSHGYFSPKECDFLRKLSKVLEKEKVEYYHTGDLDYGGIRIFQFIRENIFPELQPLNMNREIYEKNLIEGEILEETKRKKLEKVEEPILADLIQAILEQGMVIEQESFLY